MKNDRTPPGPAAGRNARLGIWFFLIYCALYAGFMGLTAFSFNTLNEPIAGVNWAIFYGMGLIFAAFVLAIIYMFMCSPAGDHAEQSSAGEDGE